MRALDSVELCIVGVSLDTIVDNAVIMDSCSQSLSGVCAYVAVRL